MLDLSVEFRHTVLFNYTHRVQIDPTRVNEADLTDYFKWLDKQFERQMVQARKIKIGWLIREKDAVREHFNTAAIAQDRRRNIQANLPLPNMDATIQFEAQQLQQSIMAFYTDAALHGECTRLSTAITQASEKYYDLMNALDNYIYGDDLTSEQKKLLPWSIWDRRTFQQKQERILHILRQLQETNAQFQASMNEMLSSPLGQLMTPAIFMVQEENKRLYDLAFRELRALKSYVEYERNPVPMALLPRNYQQERQLLPPGSSFVVDNDIDTHIEDRAIQGRTNYADQMATAYGNQLSDPNQGLNFTVAGLDATLTPDDKADNIEAWLTQQRNNFLMEAHNQDLRQFSTLQQEVSGIAKSVSANNIAKDIKDRLYEIKRDNGGNYPANQGVKYQLENDAALKQILASESSKYDRTFNKTILRIENLLKDPSSTDNDFEAILNEPNPEVKIASQRLFAAAQRSNISLGATPEPLTPTHDQILRTNIFDIVISAPALKDKNLADRKKILARGTPISFEVRYTGSIPSLFRSQSAYVEAAEAFIKYLQVVKPFIKTKQPFDFTFFNSDDPNLSKFRLALAACMDAHNLSYTNFYLKEGEAELKDKFYQIQLERMEKASLPIAKRGIAPSAP